MNRQQRKLVMEWIVAIACLAILLVFADDITKSWDSIRWYVFAVLMIAASLSRTRVNLHDSRAIIQAVVSEYPLIKVWYAVAGLAIAVGATWVIASDTGLDELLDASGILALILGFNTPVIVLVQRRKFESLRHRE